MRPVPLSAESSFASKYRVVRLVSQSATSTVYAVESLAVSMPATLEIIHPPEPLSELQLADFLRETESVASLLTSRWVTRILDSGVEAGEPWWVTPQLEGAPLDAWIARSGVLEPSKAISLLQGIGRALTAAHEAGFVHGHLTPRRIFVLEPAIDGEPVQVLDFGVAHLLHTWMPSGDMDASVAWLSPAQVRELSAHAVSDDLWAFGLIAFFMMTGQRYWKSTSSLDVLQEVLMEPLVSASVRARVLGVSSWPKALDPWFARCVSRSPDERFRDAAEATAALMTPPRRPISSYPIMANPKGSFYDDGLKEAFEEVEEEPLGEDIARGEGPYRRGQRPPEKKKVVPVDRSEPVIMGNPKGSMYDGGYNMMGRPEPPQPRSRWWIAAVVLGAAVAVALWILVFQR